MNRKAYSVLLSCLLASTFFHEFNAKSLKPAAAGALKALSREKRNIDASPLTLSSPASNLLVVLNETASVALVIDINVNVFVLLDGISGSGVCLTQNGTRGAYIRSGLWIAADVELEEFLNSIEADLSVLLTIAGSTRFNLRTVTTEILQVVTNLVIVLVATLDVELLANPTLALELILSVVGGILDLLNGPLEGLLGVIEGVIELTVDITGLLNILQGLSSVIVLVAGTLLQALAAGVVLDLALILGAVDGLVALTNLILQLGAALSLSALARLLGNAQSLCLLIAQLGGNVSVGITGLFLVLGNLLGLIGGSVQIDIFIIILIQFVAEGGQNLPSNPLAVLRAELTLLLQAIGRVNATGVLGGLVVIVKALIAGNYTVGGINISGIIQTLLIGILGPVSGLLVVVVQILILLTTVVDVVISLPYLLLILICSLDSPLGIQHLLDLGINLGRGPCICKLLAGILAALGGLLGLLLTGNVYGVLIALPVIGNIVRALDAAIRAASNGRLSLQNLLNLSTLVKNLIRGLLQLITGIQLGVSSAIVAQARRIKANSTSVSIFVQVVIIISVSA